MKLVKIAAFAFLAAGFSIYCFAQTTSQTPHILKIDLVMNTSKELCFVDGKGYSTGAVHMVEKSAFICIQSHPDPRKSHTLTATWVQISPPARPTGQSSEK